MHPPHLYSTSFFYLSDVSIEGAKEDLTDLRTYIKKAKKRSAVPPWSVPLELWWMLFFPNARTHSTTLGVGACRDRVRNPVCFTCFSSFSLMFVTRSVHLFFVEQSSRSTARQGVHQSQSMRALTSYFCLRSSVQRVFLFTCRTRTRLHTTECARIFATA